MENLVIKQSEKIVVTESGLIQVEINAQEKISLELLIEKKVQASLFIECKEVTELDLHVICKEDSQCTILSWNSFDGKLVGTDVVELKQNAICNLAYGELAQGDVDRKCHVLLQEDGAEINVRTAILSKEKKNFELICEHQARHTLSNMKNYYVLLEEGSCKMDATGKINKGASGSKSHQVSRGLTFDQQKRAVILPQLLIDENDVEASHATTLGQIDENQMYYLQSRGLTKKEATQLITTGYLLPIAEVIDDEQLRNRCKEEIEMKVNESCSM